jgi:hypothetical protein
LKVAVDDVVLSTTAGVVVCGEWTWGVIAGDPEGNGTVPTRSRFSPSKSWAK